MFGMRQSGYIIQSPNVASFKLKYIYASFAVYKSYVFAVHVVT